jgi:galactonate dehydratase
MHSSRRSLLSNFGITAGALTATTALRPFAAFAQAVGNAPKSSMPSNLKITDIKCGYIRGGSRLFVEIHTNWASGLR